MGFLEFTLRRLAALKPEPPRPVDEEIPFRWVTYRVVADSAGVDVWHRTAGKWKTLCGSAVQTMSAQYTEGLEENAVPCDLCLTAILNKQVPLNTVLDPLAPYAEDQAARAQSGIVTPCRVCQQAIEPCAARDECGLPGCVGWLHTDVKAHRCFNSRNYAEPGVRLD